MSDRDAILDALPEGNGGAAPSPLVVVRSVPNLDLWARFAERFTALGGEMKRVEDLVEFRDRSFIDGGVPEVVAAVLGRHIEDVWTAEAGVTVCDCAVAETGSVLVASRPGRSRLASLAPPVHIVLVRPSELVASLEDGFGRAPARTCWLVTGPSRTADIEGVLVRGVHGPKRVWAVPVPE